MPAERPNRAASGETPGPTALPAKPGAGHAA